MSHLKSDPHFAASALRTLRQTPDLADLMSTVQQLSHPGQAATLIEPILQALDRCSITPFYIQAIATGETPFLVSNLSDAQALAVIEQTSSWLIGRSTSCTIAVTERSVSRCHAAIGYYPSGDFYITDVGSSNGTRVNRRRLAPLERQLLQDGDLIELGSLCIEFFLVSDATALTSSPDATAATHH